MSALIINFKPCSECKYMSDDYCLKHIEVIRPLLVVVKP